jgi:hypothetical protein
MAVNNMTLLQVEMLNQGSLRWQIQVLAEVVVVLVGLVIHQVVFPVVTADQASSSSVTQQQHLLL